MAARAKQRGKKRISLSVTVVLLRAQHWYLMTPSSVLVKAVCVLCWSPEQRERADSPEPSCVSMKSDWSMDYPHDFRDGIRSIKKRLGFIRYSTTISIRHLLILVLVIL
jgi:hypothetical protein